jgi:hypothetical protein
VAVMGMEILLALYVLRKYKLETFLVELIAIFKFHKTLKFTTPTGRDTFFTAIVY